MYPKLILDILSQIRYPGHKDNIVAEEMVADDIRIDGNKVSFSIIFPKKNDPFSKSLIKACQQALITQIGEDIEVEIGIQTLQKEEPQVKEPLFGGAKVIAVASGKGGVGKSTVSANLAVSLAEMGYRVGLLDADIHGPSMPKMFDVEDARPLGEKVDGKDKIFPIEKYGVKLLSIGFFVDPSNALIWRGGMAANAIKQLINDGLWGELDYFVIDMPPGTSDIHLTLVQQLDIDGAVIVTTPQEVALADARKGIQMFQTDKINVPIIGVVENMAYFTPAELPDNKYYIFGKDGGKKIAEETGVALLEQIPLVQSMCESGDAGKPIAMTDSIVKPIFRSLAGKVVANVMQSL